MCAKTTIGVLSRQWREIFLQPIQLFGAENTESALADVQHVDQADKVDAFLVEAVPTASERLFSESLPIQRTVVAEHVVLAGHIEYLAGLDTLQILLERIEFFRLGKMTQVARMQNEVRRSRAEH